MRIFPFQPPLHSQSVQSDVPTSGLVIVSLLSTCSSFADKFLVFQDNLLFSSCPNQIWRSNLKRKKKYMKMDELDLICSHIWFSFQRKQTNKNIRGNAGCGQQRFLYQPWCDLCVSLAKVWWHFFPVKLGCFPPLFVLE